MRAAALRRLALAAALAAAAGAARAGIDDIIDAIQSSEFRFGRAKSEVPFPPLGWVQYRAYDAARFSDTQGLRPPAEAAESTWSVGGLVPVYVAARDMVVLGGDYSRSSISVRAGPYRDQRVDQATLVAAWLRQFGESETVAVFAAPMISRDARSDRASHVNGFGGVIGMHWQSDTLQWLYGAVFEYNFGARTLYPYFGVLWLPTPRWSVALAVPWPTVAYALSDRWLLEAGVSPGSTSWVTEGSEVQSTQSLGSWNFSVGGAYRLGGHFWLYAGAGLTFGRELINGGTEGETRFDAESRPVYTLALQFRP
ncbi:MAG TPA: DUF6268 family outer membrane beta-barrel protein [Burkholderiales bacterium]|nr:DUF6268 family outer membrane beta-barrel protein [Burkholderiales bacterium]